MKELFLRPDKVLLKKQACRITDEALIGMERLKAQNFVRCECAAERVDADLDAMTFAQRKRFLTSVTKSTLSQGHKKKHARTHNRLALPVKQGLAPGACCHCPSTIAKARVFGLQSIVGLIEDPSGPYSFAKTCIISMCNACSCLCMIAYRSTYTLRRSSMPISWSACPAHLLISSRSLR